MNHPQPHPQQRSKKRFPWPGFVAGIVTALLLAQLGLLPMPKPLAAAPLPPSPPPAETSTASCPPAPSAPVALYPYPLAAPAVTVPARPVRPVAAVGAAGSKWRHPLAPALAGGKCSWSKRGRSTAALYAQAISWDLPIRTWDTTMYHPGESSGVGGGYETADGSGFRPDCVAASTSWYSGWVGHEFWLERVGRVVVGDCGPGWTGKYKFDVPGPSARYVDWYDAHIGCEKRRAIVIYCPHPESCDCDFAAAWRAHHKDQVITPPLK